MVVPHLKPEIRVDPTRISGHFCTKVVLVVPGFWPESPNTDVRNESKVAMAVQVADAAPGLAPEKLQTIADSHEVSATWALDRCSKMACTLVACTVA